MSNLLPLSLKARQIALPLLCMLLSAPLACSERRGSTTKPALGEQASLTAPGPGAPQPPVAKKKRVRSGKVPSSPLGTNLEGISDWSPNWAFVDAQKRARPFISASPSTWEDKRPLDVDERGWPRRLLAQQAVRSLVFWGAPESWPAGRYVVLYDGKGKLEYDPQGKLLDSSPGRHVVALDPVRGNFGFMIHGLAPAPEQLRNVRVLMPGGVCQDTQSVWCDEQNPCQSGKRCVPFEENYATQIFHPRFLHTLEPFGALRFMDWMATNDSEQVHWKDRPKPEDATWRRGVPVEIMVQLANRLTQDAWFTMPHAADDDYVRNFAKYVRDHLAPDLHVYVEYSNEVWNGIFPQAHYAQEHGQKRFGKSGWEAQWRWYAHRMAQIHRIWSEVFAGQRERLVRVAAGQAANIGVADLILGFEGVKGNVDAIAIAPYFGDEYGSPEAAARWQNASLDELMADLEKSSLPRSIEWMRAHAELARRHKIDLLAYEGGQHLVGVGEAQENEKLNRLFDAANRDPRMKQLYLKYFAAWREAGGELFMHFTNVGMPGKYGRWGALEQLTQRREQAPKYDACVTFAEKNKRWWEEPAPKQQHTRATP